MQTAFVNRGRRVDGRRRERGGKIHYVHFLYNTYYNVYLKCANTTLKPQKEN